MPMMPLVTPSRAARSRAVDGGGDAAQDERRIAVATARRGRCMWTPSQDIKEPALRYGPPQGEGLSVWCAEIGLFEEQSDNAAGGVDLRPQVLERRRAASPISVGAHGRVLEQQVVADRHPHRAGRHGAAARY